MKNRIISMMVAAACFVGCNDFLDSESYTSLNSGNFPVVSEDVRDLLTAAYAAQTSNQINMIKSHPYLISECASDERLGGAAQMGYPLQALDKIMVATAEDANPFYLGRYQGINRANMVIEKADNCTGYKNDAEKNHMKGEAHFLRALFYWELAQVFENVPMPLSTTDRNLAQAPVDVLYAQIGSDFIQAIELLEHNQFDVNVSGVATPWAAEGFLARAYLFYTGFYNKSSMPLNNGETLTNDEVVKYLDDVIQNSGHGLVSDFRNLWSYSNEYTAKDWKYSQDNNLKWEGENNKEIMYSYKYGLRGGTDQSYRNAFMLWSGITSGVSEDDIFPYGTGWNLASVCPRLVDEWKAAEPNDPRREGSIISLKDEVPGYFVGMKGFDRWEETLFRAKKFCCTTAYTDKDKSDAHIFTHFAYGALDNTTSGLIVDFPLMRYADILLMHSELSGTADGMNEVRRRAGLPDVSYSLENIQKERRWELSFEGVRWNDIRRWHIAEDLLDNQIGVTVWNSGQETTMKEFGGGYVSRYKATNGGFRMIPQSQIDLSNNVIKQNPGWNQGDSFSYGGW